MPCSSRNGPQETGTAPTAVPRGGAMQVATRPAIQRWMLGALGVGILIAVVAESRAQSPSGDQALVLAADESLSNAMRAGDKNVARRILSLQFSFVDENG